MERELVALARPSARPPPGLTSWDLGSVAAWVGAPLDAPDALAERAIDLGRAHRVSPVLPFRVGHRPAGPRELAVALGDGASWRQRLEGLCGWVELGVHWPRPAVVPRVAPSGPGGGWLASRRAVHAPAIASDAAVGEVCGRVSDLAHRARSIRVVEGVVRVALLVRAEDEPAARSRLVERAVAVTGPWAPASFVDAGSVTPEGAQKGRSAHSTAGPSDPNGSTTAGILRGSNQR